MAGMPLRKYIKIDLSILDNTSWAGAAGIWHRDDVSSWLRAISAGNNLHYTGAQKKQSSSVWAAAHGCGYQSQEPGWGCPARILSTMCCPCIVRSYADIGRTESPSRCNHHKKMTTLSRTESGRHTEVNIWLPHKVFWLVLWLMDGFRGRKKSLRIPGIPTNWKYLHSLIQIVDFGFRWKIIGSNDSVHGNFYW